MILYIHESNITPSPCNHQLLCDSIDLLHAAANYSLERLGKGAVFQIEDTKKAWLVYYQEGVLGKLGETGEGQGKRSLEEKGFSGVLNL